ncbi:unnamed protein product [Ambrosiozyma monospora]|uniref:Unnamed protein product n=1 Tax=Ambrosiozyma monospora TaxID=43982 RepID=A0ACB5U0Q7_AMBMO|nr:unnamed protein product [Ambrosiozyma monospora]
MDNWDEAKLRQVILSKAGNPKTTTDKICKYFITAVEDGKYGWFWQCPNTDTKLKIECKYKHSLPPGFVLKTKEQRRLEKLAADEQPKITLENFIETERDKLPKDKLTPITQETFRKWKVEHRQSRLNEKAKSEAAKSTKTGREIILEKYQNKYFQEDDVGADRGTEIDMSAFKKELDEIQKAEDEGEEIKDYGDGSKAFLDANS